MTPVKNRDQAPKFKVQAALKSEKIDASLFFKSAQKQMQNSIHPQKGSYRI
jgi:hypothetical protein